jgi:hypothetical protein
MFHRVAVSIAVTVVFLLLLTQACNRGARSTSSQAQEEPTFTDVQSAANQSLVTFKKLVNAQNFKELGLMKSPAPRLVSQSAPQW